MQKKFTLFTLLLSFYTLSQSLYAQVFEGAEADKKLKGSTLIRLDEQSQRIKYVELSPSLNISESHVLAFLRKVYLLDDRYNFELIRKESDELGFTHFRYQLTFDKIPVLGSILITHIRNSRLHSFNGEVYTITPVKGISLKEEACLKIALDTVHAESYLWQIPEEEQVIKEIKDDMNASWFPHGELVYVPADLNFSSNDFHLCYKFNIHAFQPRTAENIYIETYTGRLIARENQLHTTDVPGKAYTKYSGLKTIITDSTGPVNFRLRENTRGNGVYTLNMRKGTSYGAAVDFTDSNNIWNNVNANKDEVATDCHWGAETTYDYFKNKFNRNSYNNANARINSYVHYANNYDNAFWDGLRMTYGDGSSFKPLTSLDVCGHEIAHAVTTYSANLIYSYESGQLNESFSDIFGNSIERYGKPSSYSWIIGEEITYSGTGLRNMADPRVKGHPRCYKGTNWYYGTGDNGGVHLNSGVQNWWYYLITEGGSGLNDFSNAYKVDSLGIISAEKIAYRNLTVYLTPSSQYADARFYSIQSAKDLFGPCSKEVISVTNAWYACNVGPKYDSGYVKADFTADTVVCSTSKVVNFYNLSTNAVSYKWYFGDGNTSTSFNPSNTYSAYGSYTIKLVAESCFKNKKDSLTRTAYVKIDTAFDICNALLMPIANDSTHKCASFIYDDGGENIYTQQRVSNFRISVPGADSIRIKFFDFDYELNYDSLYIYRGKYPGGVKIGGYTGSTLPNAGKYIVVTGSMVTLRHISDPYVVGRGFKLYYQAFRKPVKVTAFRDTTICYGQKTALYAKGSGGYAGDYLFQWKDIAYGDTIKVTPLVNTTYKVYLRDVCNNSLDSATANVTVRDPLELSAGSNAVICTGQSYNLQALASGGKFDSYVYTWDHGLGTGSSKSVSPTVNTTYRVIVSDGCTPINDTAYVSVRVRIPLKVELKSADTLLCYNKPGSITAEASGGDTMNYNYIWSHGAALANISNINLNSTTYVKVVLNDACSTTPATDSILIVVRPQLKVSLNNDTTLCRGRGVKLIGVPSGGDTSEYSYNWNPAFADTAVRNIQPTQPGWFKLTLSDLCSDDASDSVWIDLLAPIVVGGLKDTTICTGMSVPLVPLVSGGTGNYSYSWNLGLPANPSHLVSPVGSNVYRVIVNDGCTVLGDTGFSSITVKSALMPEILTSDTLICYGNSASFDVTATGGISSQYVYQWNNGFGSGTSKSGVFYNSSWVKVTLTDNCTTTPGTDSVYVVVRPELKVSLPNDTLICYGSDMDLTSIASGGDNSAYTYTWNQSLGGNSSHTVTPLSNTMYALTLSDNCSSPASDTVYIDLMAPIKIKGLNDTLICYGGTARLRPVVSGGIPTQYVYTWDQGLSSLPNQDINPLSSKTYKLKVSDGCSKPGDSVTLNVTVRSALSVSATLSDLSICEGDSVLLTINNSGGISAQHQWAVNGVPSALLTQWLKPANDNQYIVSLQDNCSAGVFDTVDLNVNPLPLVDFSTSSNIICRTRPIVFTNLSSGAIAYKWNFGNNDSLYVQNPYYAFNTAGIFNVKLSAYSDSGCVASVEKSAYMTVVELPESRFTYAPIQPDFLNRDVQFSNQSTNYTTFEWEFGDFSFEKVNSSPKHNYPDTGHFIVKLITVNSIGCRDTMTQLLWVKDVFRCFIPDAISINGDHINDSFVILGRGMMTYNLKIYNRWGEMVYKGSMGDKPFDGKDPKGAPLPKGTYIVNLSVRDFEGFMHYFRQVLEIL